MFSALPFLPTLPGVTSEARKGASPEATRRAAMDFDSANAQELTWRMLASVSALLSPLCVEIFSEVLRGARGYR